MASIAHQPISAIDARAADLRGIGPHQLSEMPDLVEDGVGNVSCSPKAGGRELLDFVVIPTVDYAGGDVELGAARCEEILAGAGR